MTRADFQPYLRLLADRMGLRDWSVAISPDPPSSDAVASTYLRYGIRSAKVRLSADFLIDTPEEQRSTLVHELIHCHFAAMDGVVCDWLGDDQRKAYNRLFEYGVDALAEVIALSMPLPNAGDL